MVWDIAPRPMVNNYQCFVGQYSSLLQCFLDFLAIPETLDSLDEGTILLQNVNKNLHPRKLESCVDIERNINLTLWRRNFLLNFSTPVFKM